MIFTLQRFLEDHFAQRGLDDNDQYAVRLANLYSRRRGSESEVAFAKSMRHVSTVFFRKNSIDDRAAFETALLKAIDRKFLKKKFNNATPVFPGGVVRERAHIAQGRLSIRALLDDFRRAVERRAVDGFWKSRKKGKLASKPETVGQDLLALFLEGVLRGRGGHLLREMASGVGWVDVALIISTAPHLMELKILRNSTTAGVEQLNNYMATQERDEGWLVLFDTRRADKQSAVPTTITVRAGTVRTIVVNVNPIPPSKLKPRRKG